MQRLLAICLVVTTLVIAKAMADEYRCKKVKKLKNNI